MGRATLLLALCACATAESNRELATPTFVLGIPVPGGVNASAPFVGRAFVFISKAAKAACTMASQPLSLVGDDQDTQQIFGQDVELTHYHTNEAGLHQVVIDARDLGYPVTNMTLIPPADYCVQGVFQPYETYHRKDGHTLHLPRRAVNAYEGGALFTAPGTLFSGVAMASVAAGKTVRMNVTERVPPAAASPSDTDYIKHVTLRSPSLSEFWGKDIFLEACVLIPFGFKEHPDARYPLFLYQGAMRVCVCVCACVCMMCSVCAVLRTNTCVALLLPQGHYHNDWATPVPFSETPPAANLTGYEAVQAEYAYYLYRNWTATDASSPFFKNRGLIVTLKHPTPYYDDSYANTGGEEREEERRTYSACCVMVCAM